MRSIDFYYDFRSPYACFATTRLDLSTSAGASIRWRPVFIDVLLNLQQGRKPWDEWHDILSPPKRAHFMADIFRLIEYWKVPFRMPSPARPNANAAMSIAALLDRDGVEHSAFRRGVFGVPTFVVGDELYFGADRMELLASRL